MKILQSDFLCKSCNWVFVKSVAARLKKCPLQSLNVPVGLPKKNLLRLLVRNFYRSDALPVPRSTAAVSKNWRMLFCCRTRLRRYLSGCVWKNSSSAWQTIICFSTTSRFVSNFSSNVFARIESNWGSKLSAELLIVDVWRRMCSASDTQFAQVWCGVQATLRQSRTRSGSGTVTPECCSNFFYLKKIFFLC